MRGPIDGESFYEIVWESSEKRAKPEKGEKGRQFSARPPRVCWLWDSFPGNGNAVPAIAFGRGYFK